MCLSLHFQHIFQIQEFKNVIQVQNRSFPIKKISIRFAETNEILKFQTGVTGKQLYQQDSDVIGILSSQELMSLNEKIDISTEITPIRKSDKIADQLLQDTVSYLVQVAAYKLYEGQVLKRKFDSNGYMYFGMDDMYMTDQDVESINKELNYIISQNFIINRKELSYEKAVQLFQEQNYTTTVELLKSLNAPTTSIVSLLSAKYTLKMLWKAPLLASTGLIKNQYKIFKYKDSIAIKVFSFKDNIMQIQDDQSELAVQSILYDIQQLYLDNSKSLELSTLAAINGLTPNTKNLQSKLCCFEFNHEKQIAEISRRITSNIKAIFVAGPSSSNKTTFANRLCCSLHARGIETIRISLDDYYKEKQYLTVKNEKGDIDYEHLEALDLERIKNDLQQVITGQPTKMRTYNFVTQKEGQGRTITLPNNGVIIVEGIHALNDSIANVVIESQRIKIFIQPVGMLCWDEGRLISSENTRLMRRICRDFIFRGRSAEETMKSWETVRNGEKRWILPNQCKADVYFNSSVIYEQFVLKVYLTPLLKQVPTNSDYYGQARYLLRLLAPLQPISEQLVSEQSLLREFLPGGSDYEDFFY